MGIEHKKGLAALLVCQLQPTADPVQIGIPTGPWPVGRGGKPKTAFVEHGIPVGPVENGSMLAGCFPIITTNTVPCKFGHELCHIIKLHPQRLLNAYNIKTMKPDQISHALLAVNPQIPAVFGIGITDIERGHSK